MKGLLPRKQTSMDDPNPHTSMGRIIKEKFRMLNENSLENTIENTYPPSVSTVKGESN